MKAYKCFDENLRCLGFQYEVGKTYKLDGEPVMCKNGFHSCPSPLDCLLYYRATSRWCVVEAGGEMLHSDDGTKICSSEITIVKELDLDGLSHEIRQYCKKDGKCGYMENEKDDAISPKKENMYVSTMADAGIALGGALSFAETFDAGLSVVKTGMARSGHDGIAVITEEGIAASGDWGTSYAWSGKSRSGYRGFSLTRGCMGEAYAGNAGLAVAELIAKAGNGGVAIASGKGETGTGGVVVARGTKPFAKGGLGAVLVFQDPYSLGPAYLFGPDLKVRTESAAVVVDGKEYLPDTWYTFGNEDGEYRVRRAREDEV